VAHRPEGDAIVDVSPSVDPALTRDRIVTAGIACVRRWGIRRVSMNDVAREAAVARSTVYLHFADRDALVLAVLVRTAEAQLALVRERIRGRVTLVEQVGDVATHVHALAPEEFALGLGYRPGEPQAAALRLTHTEAVTDAWLAFWVPLVEAGRERGEVRADVDVRSAAEWIMRVVISLALLPARTFDPEDPDQVSHFVTSYIVRGLSS